ncbi:MAG: DNA cytosine methyltransferase [Clostridia bacterium]|nr:DNA cytosine methyltransferase [Clostridia bacterium]
MQNHRPTAIDLFCGAGGMSLGFEQAGFDIVSAVEIDPIHAAVHKYNFPVCNTICGDIAELTGKDLCFGKEIDVLFGGPPCQGFSLMGKRDMSDPRNDLLYQFMRLVEEIKPKYFVMENVSGLTIGDAKDFLMRVIDDIELSGYRVVKPYRVLNAKDFGVPQSRQRLFLLGYRKGQAEPIYPVIDDSKLTVKDAIYDLPNIDDFNELKELDKICYLVEPISDYAKKLHGSMIDPFDFSYERKWENHVLTGCLRTQHTKGSTDRFKSTDEGNVEPISRFLKLNPSGICNTLRAGTDKSRGAYTSPRPIHPRDNRCISVREAQRLHSFPDWFRMHSTKWHGFREVGNSVPPLLARAVAAQIMSALNVIPVKPKAKIELGNEQFLYLNLTSARTLLEAIG